MCFSVVNTVFGYVSYTIPEELKRGSVVGNLAKDIGLDAKTLSSRKGRLNTDDGSKHYFEIDRNAGTLIVGDTIDREELCGSRPSCSLKYELVLEKPLEIHGISVQIQDINDNPPQFSTDQINLEIRESAIKGTQFLLSEAHIMYQSSVNRFIKSSCQKILLWTQLFKEVCPSN